MKLEDIQVTGSVYLTGSFTLPNHATSESIVNPTTGSMYNDTTDNVVKLYNGTEWILVANNTASAAGTDIEYLLVAGGGGAGWDLTAGGGAGGLLSSSLASVTSGSSFTVTVGGGGAGYTSGDLSTANDGDDSTITGTTISTITAIGGGGGARVGSGNDGGSGGGIGRGNNGTYSPGSGTSGQGNDGGADTNSPAGTGGGGAGAAGGTASGTSNPSNGGNGGDGLASSITGTSVTYAGGGGGGGYYGSAGTGGSGGGGNGSGGNAQSNQENGEANKGGGAGGGGQNSPVAASGGSGVAIFAYDTGSASGLGGTKTINGGRMVHTFNSSGTLNISSAGDFPVANASVFSPLLYTGNGGTQAITGLGFQPDLVWIKPRSIADNHNLFDSVRGITKQLISNNTSAESTQPNTLTSFDSNGFTTGPDNNTNTNGATHVAWCWKAGGTAVSNTDGTITSTVSANTDAGFSIVKYTGENAARTVGHGLDSAPEMVIIKNTTDSRNWMVWHKDLSASSYLHLNLSSQEATDTRTNGGQPRPFGPFTSNTFGVNIDNETGYTNDYIAYCFHSVDGYQKVGSYSGTGASGQTITTGFQPRFLMIKNSTTGSTSWLLLDTARDGTTENGNALFANSSAAEWGASNTTIDIDFTATGFTIQNNYVVVNATNDIYIYLAIA